MKKIVEVWHREDVNRTEHDAKLLLMSEGNYGYVKVAEVAVDDDQDEMDMLEQAYYETQNLRDSWSMDEGVDGPNATRIVPLHTYGNRSMGLRSTSLGDRLKIDDKFWRVAGIGFKLVS